MRASIVVTVIAGSLFAAAMSVLVNPRSASLVTWLTHRPEHAHRSEAPAPGDSEATAATPLELTLPAGTVIRALLPFPIGSISSRAGDSVTLSVTEPVSIGGAVAIPRGASIQCLVTEARPADVGRGAGLLSMAYKSITDAGGRRHRIKARHLRTTDLLPAGARVPGDVELQRGDILEVRLEAPLVVPASAIRNSS
jgi:hypothetical protein